MTPCKAGSKLLNTYKYILPLCHYVKCPIELHPHYTLLCPPLETEEDIYRQYSHVHGVKCKDTVCYH